MRPTATVSFDRIGRNHEVPSVCVMSDDAQVIAQAVYAHARHYLGSRTLDVRVDLDEPDGLTGTAFIFVGLFRPAGTGKVTVTYS
jgi:hypothetical protein